MSGIVLSASVRQNLLALQSTASLLAKTQNDLATGNKVNSALDNPTEYFTAQSLNNRASDISNLLDGISNGVQVLQAANTGLTSLQQLVDNAKSIANQVLQTTTGYDTKSSVTTGTITGGTATNLLNFATGPVTGSALKNDNTTSAVAITGATLLSGTAGSSSNDLATGLTTGDSLVVNGVTFSFVASINLLNGDTLNLVFNETGRSTLNIQGVIFNAGGIGLSQLTQGTDFLDSNSANQVLSQLNSASDTLRAESSALGSNLSIVQIRQDFNKNLVNVLQTGASNLILADPNEEAANSQALSTRQSIAVSALALANQSQASVLQLLR